MKSLDDHAHSIRPAAPAPAPATPPGKLRVRWRHCRTGEEQAVDVPLPFAVVGRAAGSGVQLDDPSVSQAHAILHLVDGRVYCTDLGSRNGVRADDGSQHHGWLCPGRPVRLGTFDVWAAAADAEREQQGEGDRPAPSGSAALDVYTAAGLGDRFSLDQPVTLVGRHPRCDLRLLTGAYFQFMLVRSREFVWCVDVLSPSGTLVNGRHTRACALADGDLIEVGTNSLVFRAGRSVASEELGAAGGGILFVPTPPRQPERGGGAAVFPTILDQLQDMFVNVPRAFAAMQDGHRAAMSELRDLVQCLREELGRARASRAGGDSGEWQERAAEQILLEQQQIREALARLEEEQARTRSQLMTHSAALESQLIERGENRANSEVLIAKAEEELARHREELRRERDRYGELVERLARQAEREEARPQRAAPPPAQATSKPPAPHRRHPDSQYDPAWEAVEAAARPIRLGAQPVSKPAAEGVPAAAVLKILSCTPPPNPAALEEAARLLHKAGMVGVLAAARGGDPAVRRGAARLCFHVAGQNWQGGRPADARVAAEHAARIFDQLIREAPKSVPLRIELAVVLMTLGRWLRSQRDTAGAVRALQAARAVSQRLVEMQPQSVPLGRAMAMCLHDLGMCLLDTGRPQDATECIRQALKCYQDAVKTGPASERNAAELQQLQELLKRCLSTSPRPVAEVDDAWAEEIPSAG